MRRTMTKPLWLDVVDAVIITAYLAVLFAATFMFTGLHPWEIPGTVLEAIQACCVLSIPARYIH